MTMSLSRSSSSEKAPIALDNGSSTCRMGFAGDEAPLTVFPNYIGRPRFGSAANVDECYIGSRAQERRELLSLKYPVQRAIVTNWEDMEKIWQYGFSQELKIDPTEHSVVTSEPPLNPRGNAEKMAQVMFETFNIPALNIGYEPDHILFAFGRGSGIVMNIGHGVSFAASIYEGSSPVAQSRSNFGGVDITHKLQQLLYKRGLTFTTPAELIEVENMKEKFSYIFRDDCDPSLKRYKLPDGSFFNAGSEMHEAPEILFTPDGKLNSGPSIPDMVKSCLLESDIDTRRDICVNLLICGGTSLTEGFSQRLLQEMKKLLPASVNIKVVAYPERKYSSWIGKSIFGSLSYFTESAVSKQEYEEHGPRIVHGKIGRVLV